jgi:hypothetical protein
LFESVEHNRRPVKMETKVRLTGAPGWRIR